MKRMMIGTLLLAAGCVTSSTNMDSIRARHAAQFECSEDQVEVTEVQWAVNRARGTYVAKGCNQRLVYVCDMGTCVLDSAAQTPQ